MTTLINNPNASFGQSSAPTGTQIEEFVAGAAIGEGQIVGLTINGDGEPRLAVATAATSPVIGVAVTSGGTGDVVLVAIQGPALTRAGGSSVAAAASVSATTAGRIAAGGTGANNIRLGFALEATGTTNDALVWVYVNPHTVTA